MEESVITATATTFDTLIQQATRAVIVDFWAPWCPPCRRVSPLLDALAEERPGTLTVAKVNVDDEPALARRWRIRSIPTLIRFDDGQETHRVSGAYSKVQLMAHLGIGA